MPATTADTTPQGPSLEDAAKRFESLLTSEAGENQDDTQDQAEAPADTDEGVAAEAEVEETDADKADATEAEAADAEDDAEATDDKGPQLVTVTIDGKTEQVPLEEALKGYQRHRDYSRKTADLANQRHQVEEQAKAAREERQTYATMLVALRDQLQQGQEAEPDWDAVYKADPVGYARRRDEWRDKQDKLAAAQYELQRLTQVQQQEQAENLKKVVAQGRAKMLDLNPAWKDQKVWDADRQLIVKYAQEVAGYSREEIEQAYDPRAIVYMNKARLYDELMAKKPKPVVAKGPKVAAPGAAQPAGNSARLNAAQQRLAKTGRLDDAAKVFEQLI
jgi:hypothetical protein